MVLTRTEREALPASSGAARAPARPTKSSRDGAANVAATPLDEQQVAALIRDVSFHRLGRPLRRLLDRLAASDEGTPLARAKLATALPARDRAQLGRYVAILNRLAAKATRRSALPFCRLYRGGTYVIHPTTRKGLRDILPAIERAGNHEEPLWE